MIPKRKHRLWAMVCACLLAVVLLAGCAGTNTAASSGAAASADSTGGEAAINVGSAKVKDEDLDASWNEATATKITLSGDGVTIDGEGATEQNGNVVIAQKGTYVLSGALDDGQIVVSAPEDALVRLVLNGADITCTTNAPIVCELADKLLVILAEGSDNVLTDGASYVLADETTDEPNAALFSREDLTINGSGSLTVNGNYNNGIGTKDDLIIVSGNITVTAANHAIRGRDSVTVLDGTLTLNAGNDGIQANNDEDAEKGWIELYGGTYVITSGHDGIQAETDLSILDGNYDIVAGGGAAMAEERSEDAGFGGPGGMQPPAGNTPPDITATATQAAQATAVELSDTTTADDTDDSATSTSFKGIKAGSEMTLSGGSFVIDSADDSVHSNGSITVSGGTFVITTGDDGMHADDTLLIKGGPDISINESYEGLEGAFVTITGGTIHVVASDDGINAAGGSDAATTGGMFGGDTFGGGDYAITIEGGEIRVTAGADGLDSNGTINISGGTIYVNMSQLSSGGDGILDSDGSLTITGGTLVGAGGNGYATMGQAGADDSTQVLLGIYYSSTQSAGTNVDLKDASGNTIASISPEYSFTCLLFSAPEIQQGQTYAVYTGGAETVQVTPSATVTSISDTGQAVTNTMGGGPGGNRTGG